MNYFAFVFFMQVTTIEWKSLGWAFAIFSGFGVKIAYEVSEKIKRKESITKWYWLGNVCSLFITFVVGYYSRPVIESYTHNADAQAGLYAVVGSVGFELFKIFYRIVTNKKLWEQLVGIMMNRVAAAPAQNNNTPADEPTIP